MKKLLIPFLLILLLQSCVTTYSPYKAANTGGKKCSKPHRIR